MKYTLEICANSIRSALAAQRGGADRIELCDNMAEGGTTPSAGMIVRCKELLSIPVFPIIRPRGGDFLYTSEEFEVMKTDILKCKELGCEGVVFGILLEDGSIDTERCRELVELAGPMQVTFHRAFDRCRDMEKGLEDIIAMGCDRLLTSGGAVTAIDGLVVLKKLVERAAGRISIMPGSGITGTNLLEIVRESGANEFHSTASVYVSSKMNFSAPGELSELDAGVQLKETGEQNVRLMKDLLLNEF